MDAWKTRVSQSSNPRNGKYQDSQSWIKHWQIIAFFVVIYDFIVVNGAYFLALWLRFDCAFSQIPKDYLTAWMKFTPIYSVVCFVVFYCLHLYQSMWRFASFNELKRVCATTVITCLLHILGITALFMRMPISIVFSC